MPRIELAPEITDDFDRIFDHLTAHGAVGVPQRIAEIVEALDILERHPLIGRSVEADLRELVIGKASRGYLALYQYLPAADIVFILAIRSQREAGYFSG